MSKMVDCHGHFNAIFIDVEFIGDEAWVIDENVDVIEVGFHLVGEVLDRGSLWEI